MDWKFDQTNISGELHNITSSTGGYRVIEVVKVDWPKRDLNEFISRQTYLNQLQLLEEIDELRSRIKKKHGTIFDPQALDKMREERNNELMH